MIWRAGLAICVGFALTMTSARAAVSGDPVQIDTGAVRGAWRENAAVRAYLGIPFAAAPVGDLRWRPPQPAASWTGVREAIEPGPQCPQAAVARNSVSYEVYGERPQSEDCLTLNVWAPRPPRA